jgi:upstream activation factor subunit UAF30
MKVKKSSSKKNVTSGFLKPINISSEMASFTGWDPKQLYSRVSVTQHICEYIKKNNLFNPEDKRQIKCDAKLKSLLRYDAATSTEPLTYFRLQQYLKPHFIKTQ